MSVTELYTVRSGSLNPYENLAVEEQLLKRCREQEFYLYLWQNQNTVVIGRNQSAFRECRVALLNQEGGHLARRLSGGGAVYHDLGNLNFTFVTWRQNYDLARQLQIILSALQSLAIKASFSGRNDLLIDGRKFSGNAFYYSQTACYHHGTLMVNVDKEKCVRYLKASSEKLKANGVDSVRSRIINLQEVQPQLSIAQLTAAMTKACEAAWQLPAVPLTMHCAAGYYASPAWLYRKEAESSYELSRRLSFGELTLRCSLQDGILQNPRVFTDAMTDDFSDDLEALLAGSQAGQAAEAVRASGLHHRAEIAQMLEELK